MGRNRSSAAGRFGGLTPEKQAELEALTQWITDKEHRQGYVGYTVHHQRRDALIAERDGAAPEPSPIVEYVTPQEDHEDDAD